MAGRKFMSILASGYLILLYTLGVAFTVLFRKFICKEPVVSSLIMKCLKHGSITTFVQAPYLSVSYF